MHEITRINLGDYEKELINTESYNFLLTCCTGKLNTPDKVIEECTSAEFDILSTSDGKITAFEWDCKQLGSITGNHQLKTLQRLKIDYREEMSIDLSGFPNLKSLQISTFRGAFAHLHAQGQYRKCDFPKINWGDTKIQELDIRGFGDTPLSNADLKHLKNVISFNCVG